MTLDSVPAAKAGSAAIISLLFAAFAWSIRGVSASGAAGGAVVCFALIVGAGWGGFAALGAVFLLTWAATRIGYSRKRRLGTAESRGGRDARQVFANVAVAAACAVLNPTFHAPRFLVAMAAALAEAAGDTLESEIGQAWGAEPHRITDWKKAPVGTDGAITWAGTLAGITAVVAVTLVCLVTGLIPGRSVWICASSAMVATFLDSLLGATLERERMLGNNAVNFVSTLFAAVLGFAFS